MAQQTINIGTAANDGTGDSLRVGATKINQNFNELYTTTNGLSGVASSGSYNDLSNKPTIPSDLADLNNVAATAPTNGQYLKWNGVNWQPDSLPAGSGIALTDLSVGAEPTAAGNGAIAYNNTTGEFTYTPPTLSGLGYTAPTLNSLGVGSGDVDFGAYKITYSNNYAQESDLPSASTYHGMFAHVHGTGKAYFSHAGTWEKLITESTYKTLVADSADFADFQSRVAAL